MKQLPTQFTSEQWNDIFTRSAPHPVYIKVAGKLEGYKGNCSWSLGIIKTVQRRTITYRPCFGHKQDETCAIADAVLHVTKASAIVRRIVESLTKKEKVMPNAPRAFDEAYYRNTIHTPKEIPMHHSNGPVRPGDEQDTERLHQHALNENLNVIDEGDDELDHSRKEHKESSKAYEAGQRIRELAKPVEAFGFLQPTKPTTLRDTLSQYKELQSRIKSEGPALLAQLNNDLSEAKQMVKNIELEIQEILELLGQSPAAQSAPVPIQTRKHVKQDKKVYRECAIRHLRQHDGQWMRSIDLAAAIGYTERPPSALFSPLIIKGVMEGRGEANKNYEVRLVQT